MKIACCILAYNNIERMIEYFEEYHPFFCDAKMDVFIYDSSSDGEIKDLVEQNVNSIKGYFRFEDKIHANLKAYKVFQMYGIEENYDFVWLLSDAVRFSKKALNLIASTIDRKYDIFMVYTGGVTTEYADINEFFYDCGWKATSFGSVLINARRMSEQTNWRELESKFLIEDHINYSHFAFYFCRLAEIENPLIYYLSVEQDDMKNSVYKKSSSWDDEMFEIICKRWSRTIESLPDVYSNKQEVARMLGDNSVLCKDLFWNYKLNGTYTREIYRKYKAYFGKVCSLPDKYLDILSFIDASDNSEFENKLKAFFVTHEEVYLYGAGKKANRILGFLLEYGFEISGVITSNNKEGCFGNYSIIPLSIFDYCTKKTGIVIATNFDNATDIFQALEKRNIEENDIFLSRKLICEI